MSVTIGLLRKEGHAGSAHDCARLVSGSRFKIVAGGPLSGPAGRVDSPGMRISHTACAYRARKSSRLFEDSAWYAGPRYTGMRSKTSALLNSSDRTASQASQASLLTCGGTVYWQDSIECLSSRTWMEAVAHILAPSFLLRPGLLLPATLPSRGSRPPLISFAGPAPMRLRGRECVCSMIQKHPRAQNTFQVSFQGEPGAI